MNDEVEIILQPEQVNVTEPLVADYILPKATSSVLGGVKIGANVDVASDGTIYIPVATSSSLGVVQAGEGITINENGVISASSSYVLPQATKNTLGGVYVDDALTQGSVNPVQNDVVNTAISNLTTEVSALSDTVGDLDDDLTGVENDVSTLSSNLTSLGNSVSTNTNNISTITGNISNINSEIGNINLTLTDHGNSIDALAGLVSSLNADISETYTYQDIDDQIWTAGEIDIRGKGFYAVMYVNLEGSLTIPSGQSVTLFTLPEDYIPYYDAYGGADIVDGSISIKVDSATGNIILINNNTSSMNIGKLNASIPVIYGSI